MRQVRFWPVLLLAFLLSSCNDEHLIKDVGSDGQGALSLNLSMDSGTVAVKSDDTGDGKMTAQDTLDQFKVEIYRKVSDDLSDGILLYREPYSVARQGLIPLDAGDYYLRARFGNSLGVGFDKPYLMGQKEFTVRPQTRENVEVVAGIANVKVSVEFGDYFQEYYPDYYVKVVNTDPQLVGYKNSVKFSKDEKRSAFIPVGDVTVEVYADFKGDGNWSYYRISGIDADSDGVLDDSEKFTYSPMDHITFRIDAADKLYGNLMVNIKVENGTDNKEYDTEIPEYKAPQDAPKASRQGFDIQVNGTDGYCYVYEGRDPEYNDGQSFSYSAKAGLKSCVLNISSAYLKTAFGLDGAYTLATLAADDVTVVPNETVIEKLKAAGIRCSIGKFMGIVDFTEAMKALGKNSVYVSDTTPCAVFSMTVTDESGAIASTDGNMVVWPQMVGTFSIPAYDVWGWKVAAPVVNLSKGKAEYCQLQFSEDGKNWTTVQNNGSVSGLKVTFADHDGLAPDTDYWFRAYDPVGQTQVGNVAKVHTESPLQLGNAGFEDWWTESFKYVAQLTSWWKEDMYRDWYHPSARGSSDVWWAVNSKKTMPDNVTREYQTFKVFPTVSYSVNDKHSGNYSAQMMTIGVGRLAQSSGLGSSDKVVVPGEIFIGTADYSGNPTYSGHSFASRPGKISFWYQYVPSSKMTDDKFYVLVEVKSGNTTIAKKEITDGPAASGWTEYIIDLGENYSVKNMKATTIIMSFKSSKNTFSANTNYLDENVSVEVAGSSYNVHRGSVLRIDDIKVLYE